MTRDVATLLAIAGRDGIEAALTANGAGLDAASIGAIRCLVAAC